MAAAILTADMTILKNSQILVDVEEALADILVVSYLNENKKFRGVLLDSTKRNLPFGVYNLNPAFNNVSQKIDDVGEDKLYSSSQRFAYQETQYAKKPIAKSKTQSRSKMSVRLRPRKVLCSKCQGICNENSENVDVGRKGKLNERDLRSSRTMAPSKEDENKTIIMGHTLIPRISRLQPSEISNAINGTASSTHVENNDEVLEKSASNRKRILDCESVVCRVDNSSSKDCESNASVQCDSRIKNKDNIPQLTFVNVPDIVSRHDGESNACVASGNIFSSAKTLKISYGEGEGTVLKLPALVSGDFNEDVATNADDKMKDSKSAKRALKRAKKAARRIATKSPKLCASSPRQLQALSPCYGTNINIEIIQRKHKHKVKHKKKNKLKEKESDPEEVSSTENIKEHCLNQKLSISLKRLSTNSYTSNSDSRACFGDEASSGSGSEVWEDADIERGEVREGDVVWGKLQGFPWWPGRVVSRRGQEALVAWYASTTSSTMECQHLVPFLQQYKLRFNKKRRGPYKEAVRLAELEATQGGAALEGRDMQMDPLGGAPNVVSLPDMSPTPINVLS